MQKYHCGCRQLFLNEMKEADLIVYHHSTHLTTHLDSRLIPAPMVKKITHNTSHPHTNAMISWLIFYSFAKTEPRQFDALNVPLFTYDMCAPLTLMRGLPASFPSPQRAGLDD